MTKAPVVEEQGRKAIPSDQFKARMRELMTSAQQQADANGESLIVKSAFLSDDEDDIAARHRMADYRDRQKAAGWVFVGLWLDPTQVAVVKGHGRHKKLASCLHSIIGGLLRRPGASYRAPVDDEPEQQAEQDDQQPEGGPQIVGRVKGTLIELWQMDDGSVDGVPLYGASRGPRLSTMPFADLVSLWHGCRISLDARDVALVEGYLDAVYEDWREAANPQHQAQAAQAAPYEVLGLESTASYADAKAAYRRLIRTAHPDAVDEQGRKTGNAWIFRAVQQAWETIDAVEKARKEQEAREAEEAAKAARKAARQKGEA